MHLVFLRQLYFKDSSVYDIGKPQQGNPWNYKIKIKIISFGWGFKHLSRSNFSREARRLSQLLSCTLFPSVASFLPQVFNLV